VNWGKTAGLPLAYLAAVVWAVWPPPPKYALEDSTVVEVSDTGTPVALHAPPPGYPEAALRRHIEGTVRVAVIVNDEGRPANVQALEGPAELRDAAVQTVRNWQFTPVAAEVEVQVPFLLYAGPRRVELPEPVQIEKPYAGVGRHGTVRLVATVDETGRVESAKAVAGPQRLRKAAESNVRRWTFRPELHDGKPARGTVVVEVAF